MTLPLASYLAKIFLLFSHTIIIAPLLFIGFISRGTFFIKKPTQKESMIWANACLLVLFSMIFNVFLKSLFQIPLNPALGIKGFAFPSGHMLVAVVFYGWLTCSYPSWKVRAFTTIVLLGIAFGLIQQGYHNLRDIFGAVMFGVITLYAFNKAYRLPTIAYRPVRITFILIPICLFFLGIISMRIGITSHVTKTFIGLIAFSVMWAMLNRTIWKHTSQIGYC